MKTLLSCALLVTIALLTPACDPFELGDGRSAGFTPSPISGDAFEAAAKIRLAELKPLELPGLHNVFHLGPAIISGSEPQGEDAFRELERLGVKTILSVDGKAPDAAAADRHGMRYVHVPIQYRAVTPKELVRIAKTFRELEPPFYVHCFHGKHRGPAAAAIGRIARDGTTREQALAEMRQWCGASGKYSGLYRDIATRPIPTAAESRAIVWSFPAKARLEGYRHAMVKAARSFDHLIALSARGWKADPAHPDIDARNEAEKLAQIMVQAVKLPRTAGSPEEFQRWSAASAAASRKLHGHLEALATGEAGAKRGANEAYQAVRRSCTECHGAYRNR